MTHRTLLATVLWLAPFAASLPAPPTGPAPTSAAALERYWEVSLAGGPGKDGIPSIDEPEFTTAGAADEWLAPGDIVIGIHHRGEARAYPQRILVWHEIVNDRLGGTPVSVTYCPLTGTALGFERGHTEFGVSGRLVNSNLIMYDRATGSHWPQILGTAVEGSRKGKGLRQIRVFWTTWARWRERHPDTRVLSRETGHARSYRRDPYGAYNPRRGYYAEHAARLFPVMHGSDRYPPKHVVFVFRTPQVAVAVDRDALRHKGILRHRGEHADYLVLHDPTLDTAWVYRADKAGLADETALDDVTFTAHGPRAPALDDLEPVPGFEAMWFAWHAFYPDTVILDGSGD